MKFELSARFHAAAAGADASIAKTSAANVRHRHIFMIPLSRQLLSQVPIADRRPFGKSAGGEGGIRTHGGLAPTAVFKTAALNHSATSPIGLSSRQGRACRASCAPSRVGGP